MKERQKLVSELCIGRNKTECAVASKRKRNVSVEHAILSFHHDIKNGPDFVCTCCHGMVYRKSGVPCNLAK